MTIFDFYEDSLSTSDRNNSNTAWLISAIHIPLLIKLRTLLYESTLYYLCSSPLQFDTNNTFLKDHMTPLKSLSLGTLGPCTYHL